MDAAGSDEPETIAESAPLSGNLTNHKGERALLLHRAPAPRAPIHESLIVELSQWPTLRFDTAAFPLREIALRFLQANGTFSSTAPHCSLCLSSASLESFVPIASVFTYGFTKWLRAQVEMDTAFCAAYEALIRQVVAPWVLGRCPDGERVLLYQYPPTLRIHPSTSPPRELGRLHRDAEFGHQPGEINIWMPLTCILGPECPESDSQGRAERLQRAKATSLSAEHVPGDGNLQPFELHYGEMRAFHGTLCMHQTHPNDSGATRVSLDFRVGPEGTIDTDWVLPGVNYRHQRRRCELPK